MQSMDQLCQTNKISSAVPLAVCQNSRTLLSAPQEFLKNVKREFSKLVTVLQAYALIATRVRLIATNQVRAGNAFQMCIQTPPDFLTSVSMLSH